MKILLVLTLAFVFMTPLVVAADKCNGRCSLVTQCCIDYGLYGVCTAKGMAGDYCGGAVYCDDCIVGSVCIHRQYSIWNRLKPGKGYCRGVSFSI